MNENLKQLMLEAGYAAPELATRAQALAELLVKRCAHLAFNAAYPQAGVKASSSIKHHFGMDHNDNQNA